jgi:general L-amino acid transport system permease protein
VTEVGVLGWLHRNLFAGWRTSALTVVALGLLWWALPPLVKWALLDADWLGTGRADCDGDGACWVFISVRLNQFLYGFYPAAEQWRVELFFGVLFTLLIPLFIRPFRYKGWLAGGVLFVYPWLGFALLEGNWFGLEPVETARWGGLTLTLILAGIGCLAALPIGVLLALGRRAESMPIVKSLCVVFIEFWRGVPLITVLFMSSVMLPLFLPEGVHFDKLLRALIGITLFESAYMAEVVRGGLQAIPRGQYEAADALGLNYAKKTALVILPQALKIVIPGIVNTFIALIKDTTLVLIIGLLELLGMIHNALNDPNWLGFSTEGYAFTALVFWIICFSLSRYSQRLERRLHTGHAP